MAKLTEKQMEKAKRMLDDLHQFWVEAGKEPDAKKVVPFTKQRRAALGMFEGWITGMICSLQERVAELEIDAVKFAGIWRDGTVYPAKSLVTDKSALWISVRETASRPPSGDWKLAAKSHA